MNYAPFPASLIGFRPLKICDGCGALVVDTAVHDRFHASYQVTTVITIEGER